LPARDWPAMRIWGRRSSASSALASCGLREDAQALMRAAMRQMHLSARAYHRVLKVSRTMGESSPSDLEGAEAIQTHHLAEALQYRARVLDM